MIKSKFFRQGVMRRILSVLTALLIIAGTGIANKAYAASGASEAEYNDTADTATPISQDIVYTGAINEPGDRDYYSATLSGDKAAVFRFVGGKQGSWEISVFSAEMKQLAHGVCKAGKTVELSIEHSGKCLFRITPLEYSKDPYTVTLSSDIIIKKRIAGRDRIATSVKICGEGWDSADNVIVANGFNFADALAGVPLAKALDAPILLTANLQAPEYDIMAEIDRLKAKNVYILGGTAAVNGTIEEKLKKYASVTRVAGKDRYETAVRIAEKLASVSGKNPECVFFACSQNFPDALSAGPAAALEACPILYISPTGGLDSVTKNYVSSAKCKSAVILGGKAAVSDKGEADIKKQFSDVSRISGSDRYDTAVKVYQKYSDKFTGSGMAIATGAGFPDALAGGALSAKQSIPMILVGSSLGTAQKDIIIAASPDTLYIFGGTAAVSDAVVSSI